MLWIALAYLASAAADLPTPSACPVTNPIQDFDFGRYFSGKWYEIARYDNFVLETKADCTFGEYIYSNGVSNFTLYDVIEGKMKSFGGDVQLLPEADGTGKILYTFDRFAQGKYPLNVLSTDYDDYGVMYNCYYDDDRKNFRELAWIMSRTTVLSQKAKVALDKIFEETHVIDWKKVVWEHFNKESCLFDV